MAGSNSDRSKMVYVRVMGGEFRVEAKEGEIKDGLSAVIRDKKDKDGKVTGSAWYFVYDNMDGYVDSMRIDYNDNINSDVLSINQKSEDDIDEVWQIQLKPSSYFSKSLVNRMMNPSYDPSKEVRLKVYDFIDDSSKRRCGISVYQHSEGVTRDWGVKIEGFFNQNNPDKESPAWDEKFRKDEEGLAIWKIKMSKHAKDLASKAIERVIPFKPMDGDKPVNFSPPPSANDSNAQPEAPGDETDDLPF